MSTSTKPYASKSYASKSYAWKRLYDLENNTIHQLIVFDDLSNEVVGVRRPAWPKNRCGGYLDYRYVSNDELYDLERIKDAIERISATLGLPIL